MAIMQSMMAIRFCVTAISIVLPMLSTSAEPPRLPQLERVTVVAAPKVVANFTLTDQNGAPRTLASLRGAPTLVFFGFTRCPDICPAAMTKLKMMHESNDGAFKRAQVVLVSVDGERDTPEALKKYMAWLPKEFIGLTGNPRAVSDIAARFSAVAYKEQADANGNYGYYHSSQIFLLDKDGRRYGFNHAAPIKRVKSGRPAGK
jgi:protein SCO1/2